MKKVGRGFSKQAPLRVSPMPIGILAFLGSASMPVILAVRTAILGAASPVVFQVNLGFGSLGFSFEFFKFFGSYNQQA